tara:strand:+ start:12008 stop:14602 length:2595 start_codon:yes stop_codon:yes gene_type:complete
MEFFIKKLAEKVEKAKSDSDFTYFFNLLVSGEALSKLVVLSTVACLNPDKDRHQYRVLHTLVRASGVGEWSKELDELLTGTASQYLDSEFRPCQAELTKKANESEWQYQAIDHLIKTMECLGIETQVTQGKRDLKIWFKLFTELRNKTRGHGAPSASKASNAAVELEKSLEILLSNLSILKIPCAYIKRNLSGKYRVTPINSIEESFDRLKKSTEVSIEDGIYIYVNGFRCLKLIESDPDLQDFYIANGGFSNKKYELLSYYSDDKKVGDSSEYMQPPGQLPPSESEGLGELRVAGNCFSNVPGINYEYINRPELEDELFGLLMDDRRDLVTLLGRGGIGKTSLALRVIPRLFYEEKYETIIWFSSRDIDLQESGAKLVNADVITSKDIAKYYCRLVVSEKDLKSKDFDPIKYFQDQLTESDIGACLFVFDNFETTENPIELYKWIDTYVRRPNKILITTRLRDFKGDYPLTVHGMTEQESKELIRITAESLNIKDKINQRTEEEIYNASSGHPYIIKILLGELAAGTGKQAIRKIIANSDEILIALFERTYAALSPCSQRIFLTLSAWNSAISRDILEAVLMNSFEQPQEVEKAIDSLIQYSMAEEVKSERDGRYFIGLPFVATSFGKKKLCVSPLESIVLNDSMKLQRFGPLKLDDKNKALANHVLRFLSSLDTDDDGYEVDQELLDHICMVSNASRLDWARWLVEDGRNESLEKAIQVVTLYLENETNRSKKLNGWRILADIHRQLENHYEEIHALIQLAEFSDVDFSELSNVANKINYKLGKNLIVIEDYGVKNLLISDLYQAMKDREEEADAVGLSRLAWLALHLNKPIAEVKGVVKKGLELDPLNQYCLKLSRNLAHR